jgi:hypothetical protein
MMRKISFLLLIPIFFSCSESNNLSNEAPETGPLAENDLSVAERMAIDACDCMKDATATIDVNVRNAFIQMAELPKGADYKAYMLEMDSVTKINFLITMMNLADGEVSPDQCIYEVDLKYENDEYPGEESFLEAMKNVTGCDVPHAIMKVGFGAFE